MKAWIPASLIFALACSTSATAADNEDMLTSKPFLAHHPDLKWRLEGFRVYDQRDHPGAITRFLKAARFGDKLSQAMLSEMHRLGQGVPIDMAAAYAWMDVAAERGYPDFVIEREKLWASLEEAQRRAAVRKGIEIHAEYGDAAARPRMDRILRRAAFGRTGSRLGSVGRMEVLSVTGRDVGGGYRLGRYGSGDQLFASKYWKPDEYRDWQDRTWNPERKGEVDVGPAQPVKTTTPEDPDGSR